MVQHVTIGVVNRNVEWYGTVSCGEEMRYGGGMVLIVQYGTAPYGMVWYGIVLYGKMATLWYGTVWYDMVR